MRGRRKAGILGEGGAELEASTSMAAEPFSSINLELGSHQKIRADAQKKRPC